MNRQTDGSTPSPPALLSNEEREKAKAASVWMERFITKSLESAAINARAEILLFGHRQSTKAFNVSGAVIQSSEVLKLISSEPQDESLTRKRLSLENQLATWLADRVQGNRHEEIAMLARVLSSRKKQKKPTLRWVILLCLEDHIIRAGGPRGGLTGHSVVAQIFLQRINVHPPNFFSADKSREEALAQWWRGPHFLLPRHLPSKVELRKMTHVALFKAGKEAFNQKTFDAEFYPACTELGLAALD
jgi:hypothetical protein